VARCLTRGALGPMVNLRGTAPETSQAHKPCRPPTVVSGKDSVLRFVKNLVYEFVTLRSQRDIAGNDSD
jgi:hypothetical protein